ncbi:UDP-N-acetylmuramoyl-tripeptide--D-alanyl-D-alanine ligase [Formicincola oecophyllae]|uniref:UDP-N-acetylmuramoyl-tripeptide--D-alanyl-D-alanine ligase n=1 Tax=Formicincola oecophyllae TaxID=2558361 RepID=A0A4Y6U976_9PROT|nr:UDP-N-acetylmuramoyl-tripeptide--D-alanyl-D-alanine ligase [Formicincola oecophyllae]QDH13006.1 UDP-N-acetylmuramoyl-tripeptide--D-alanyl-D-alanine ligase [Formicincola oecophyllae]
MKASTTAVPANLQPLWRAGELAQAVGGQWQPGAFQASPEQAAAGCVAIDSRTISQPTPGEVGALFVALRGATDGHRFIRKALENGACCIVADNADTIQADGTPLTAAERARLLLVGDTFKALEDLGRYARARFQGQMVAVTGSVGKTTVKTMMALALEGAAQATGAGPGGVHAAKASFNNHLGVPLTLANMPPTARYAVCEIGMNHPGEVFPLAAMVKPDVAIITNIGTAHLGNMGSQKAIAEEKAALFQTLDTSRPGPKAAIFPLETPCADVLLAAVPKGVASIGLVAGKATAPDGLRPTHNVVLSHLVESATGSHGTLNAPSWHADLPGLAVNTPGRHLLEDAALVGCALLGLGLAGAVLDSALRALSTFNPGRGRGAVVALPSGVSVIDESYNASGPSVRAALSALRLRVDENGGAGRAVAALGDIRELGVFSAAEHKGLASAVQGAGVLAFCCGPGMRHLYDALPPELQGGWAETPQELAHSAAPILQPHDIVLVKGSNGSRMDQFTATLAALLASLPPPG